MFIVDTDVIDAHMENLMESLHSPQVSHNHLNKSTDLFTITWITLSELPTSIHNTMNNIFISFRKLTSKEKIFKGAIKTISGVLSKIKVAHYQVQIGGSFKVLIDNRQGTGKNVTGEGFQKENRRVYRETKTRVIFLHSPFKSKGIFRP